MDLPERLPLFVLPGAIVLPRVRLPLHVFEPRYLTMLDDVMKSGYRLIGMIQPRDDEESLNVIGCAGRLTSFTETDDGRYMITLTGISRFRIAEEEAGFSPYRRARVDWAPFSQDLGRPEHDPDFDRETFLPNLQQFLEAEELSTDWDQLMNAEDEQLINSLSMLCPFVPLEKQALLEAPSLSNRRQTLESLIGFALRNARRDEVMQ